MDESEQDQDICLAAILQNKYAIKSVKIELPVGAVRDATKHGRHYRDCLRHLASEALMG